MEKVIEEKVPWIPLIVLSIVMSFFIIASYRLLAPLGSQWQCGYNFGMISRITCVAVYPYLLIILAYPLRRWFKVSPGLLTYLYAAGLISSFTFGFGWYDPIITLSRPRIFDTHNYLDVWWEPPVSSIEAMIAGNVPTDWVAWGPIVFVLSLLYISFWFFTSSITLIFRRSWIDVERIPFPLTITGYEVLKTIHTENGRSERKKPFLIGVILAFIFGVPVFMARTFPWFPDIYAWRGTCPSGALHSQEYDVLGSTIAWYSGYAKDPISVAIFLLVPVNISFNVWFWTLVMMVLEQVAFNMGYYTGALSLGGNAKLCCFAGVNTTAPFYWPLTLAGGSIAITVMYMVLHRDYMVETIMAAIGRLDRERTAEVEKDEAMSYRSTYIMMIVSATISIASLMMFGVNFWAALLILLVSCGTTWFAMTLLLGAAGFGANDMRMWAAGPFRLIWPDPGTVEPSTDYIMTHVWGQGAQTWGGPPFGNGFFTTALSLKMASLTGTSNRETFLVSVVCMVVGTPVLFASSVWWANLYGLRTLAPWGGCAPESMCEAGPLAQAARPSSFIYFSYTAATFLCTALLAFFHAKFIWFPFEPLGFIIATSFPGQWNHVWSTYLVAWIIKRIVLRMGGSALYERHVVPAVGGFIGGTALCAMIGIITGMVKFYVPY